MRARLMGWGPGGSLAMAAGLLGVALGAAGCGKADTSGVDRDEVHGLTRSDETERDRGNAVQRAREAARVLTRGVPGMRQGISVYDDSCEDGQRGPWLVRCTVTVTFYLGVDGELPDVLPRIADAAAKAGVGMPQDQKAIGSLGYALDHVKRKGGRDGVPRSPYLGVPGGLGGTLHWDDPYGEDVDAPSPATSRYDDGKGLYQDYKVIPGLLEVNGVDEEVETVPAMRNAYDMVVVWRMTAIEYARYQRAD